MGTFGKGVGEPEGAGGGHDVPADLVGALQGEVEQLPTDDVDPNEYRKPKKRPPGQDRENAAGVVEPLDHCSYIHIGLVRCAGWGWLSPAAPA